VNAVGPDVSGEARASIDDQGRTHSARDASKPQGKQAEADERPTLVAQLHAQEALGQAAGDEPHAPLDPVVAERGIGDEDDPSGACQGHYSMTPAIGLDAFA
jgi:hypothetical protein